MRSVDEKDEICRIYDLVTKTNFSQVMIFRKYLVKNRVAGQNKLVSVKHLVVYINFHFGESGITKLRNPSRETCYSSWATP